MWSDPKTQAAYTQAQKGQMTGLPAYKKLLGRLVQIETVPEPVAATKEKKARNENIVDNSTVEQDNSNTNS